MPETWGAFAIARPGPDWKLGQYPHGANKIAGAVFHSAEGSLEGAFSVLDGPRRASWHITVSKGGQYYQHYAIEKVTWHAGLEANPLYIGVEFEGIAGEPLTPEQVHTGGQLLLWLHDRGGWAEYTRGVTLFEHNEFMPTACPSGRIPWDELIDELLIDDLAPLNREQAIHALAQVLAYIEGTPPPYDILPEYRDVLRRLAQ